MSEDARQSLIALFAVLSFVGVIYVGLWLLTGIELPDWIIWAGPALSLYIISMNIIRWLRARRNDGA